MLMSMASFAAKPVLPVCADLSLPARSTNCILLVITLSTAELSMISTLSVKMACDLDEAWFKL